MSWHVTLPYETYEQARDEFTWDIPEKYDAFWNVVGKHDNPDEWVALYQAYPDGRRRTYTFQDMDDRSAQLAGALTDLGVEFGDRVGIVLPQKPENLVTHLASWRMGAISIPLSVLFGEDGLRYRLKNSGAAAVVVDESVRETVETVRDDCPDLEHVIVVDGDAGADVHEFDSLIANRSTTYEKADVDGDTPSIIVYTSGSTGDPKGVVHSHRSWVGHCPGYYMYFERDVLDKTVAWTPADWAWLGALADAVFTSWHYGQPIVGYPMDKFDPEVAFELAEEFGVTDTFLPPTAIRMMMDVDDPTEQYDLELDAICSGGESLTSDILVWAQEELEGVAVNEFYGQTEANMLTVNCQDWFEARPGSMGKVPPGREVTILDTETREPVDEGEVGEIAVQYNGPDPIPFIEYWKMPEKTAGHKHGDWHLTGDLGYRDEDGYHWYKSRVDDVIITSGYRVGPQEVEDGVLEHPDVAQVGVIGVPDDTRGNIIKAFVEPRDGVTGTAELKTEIQDLVSDRLAKYEYPREIEFMDGLPQTTTGKIRRTQLRDIGGIEDQ